MSSQFESTTVDLLSAQGPSFNAVQVFPVDTHFSTELVFFPSQVDGPAATITLQENTKLLRFNVFEEEASGSNVLVNFQLTDEPESTQWVTLEPGVDFYGVPCASRTLKLKLRACGDKDVFVQVLERS